MNPVTNRPLTASRPVTPGRPGTPSQAPARMAPTTLALSTPAKPAPRPVPASERERTDDLVKYAAAAAFGAVTCLASALTGGFGPELVLTSAMMAFAGSAFGDWMRGRLCFGLGHFGLTFGRLPAAERSTGGAFVDVAATMATGVGASLAVILACDTAPYALIGAVAALAMVGANALRLWLSR